MLRERQFRGLVEGGNFIAYWQATLWINKRKAYSICQTMNYRSPFSFNISPVTEDMESSQWTAISRVGRRQQCSSSPIMNYWQASYIKYQNLPKF